MANEVTMKTEGVDVMNRDVVFDVKQDGAVVGTLKISKGTVEWRPRNYTNGFHMTWPQFDSLMQQHGKQ